MRVNRYSWHFWIFKQLSRDASPSVCKYICVIALAPLAAILFIALLPAMLILLAVDNICSYAYKRGVRIYFKTPTCPFGNVEFEDHEDS